VLPPSSRCHNAEYHDLKLLRIQEFMEFKNRDLPKVYHPVEEHAAGEEACEL